VSERIKSAFITFALFLYFFITIGWIGAECTRSYCLAGDLYVNWHCVLKWGLPLIALPVSVVLYFSLKENPEVVDNE